MTGNHSVAGVAYSWKSDDVQFHCFIALLQCFVTLLLQALTG